MKEIDPKQTKRAKAYELWLNAPMPMVTLLKSLDITNLVTLSREKDYKFNMLMCWCIGKAAMQTEEFYILPVGKKLRQYDKLALNIIVATQDNDISPCDVPFSKDLQQFNADYIKLTEQVKTSCCPYSLGEDYMMIGTSSLAKYDIDGAINMYSGVYNNPFLIWSRYKAQGAKKILSLSFQFHHIQMDGIPAAGFLECLQREIELLKI